MNTTKFCENPGKNRTTFNKLFLQITLKVRVSAKINKLQHCFKRRKTACHHDVIFCGGSFISSFLCIHFTQESRSVKLYCCDWHEQTGSQFLKKKKINSSHLLILYFLCLCVYFASESNKNRRRNKYIIKMTIPAVYALILLTSIKKIMDNSLHKHVNEKDCREVP